MKCVVMDHLEDLVVVDTASDLVLSVSGCGKGREDVQVTYHNTVGEARAMARAIVALSGKDYLEFPYSNYRMRTARLRAKLDLALKEAREAGEMLAGHVLKDYSDYRRYMEEVLFE